MATKLAHPEVAVEIEEEDLDDDGNLTDVALSRLTSNQKAMYEAQQRFLRGYGKNASIQDGCTAANVSQYTYDSWQRYDKLGFRERRQAAHRWFCDDLERISMKHVRGIKPGQNPLTLIVRLNAEMPEKYKRMESSDSPALDVIKSIKALAKGRSVKVRAIEVEVGAETRAEALLEGKRRVVEAEVVDVDGEGAVGQEG